MGCSDPSQFRSLVAPHCTDLRSDKCTWALVKAGGAFGPGCLDLSIVASPELGLPPYRDYVCPRSTGALARLCGPPKQQVASNTGAGTSTGSSYGTLAAGLGASTTVLALTTAGVIGRMVHIDRLHADEKRNMLEEHGVAMASTDYLMNNARRLNERFSADAYYNPQHDPELTSEFKLQLKKPSVVPGDAGSGYVRDTGRL